MSAFNEAGNYGLLAKIDGELKGLHRKTRADLLVDPTGAAGIRGIVDQLIASELHVGANDALILCDAAGDQLAAFNDDGTVSIGVSGQVTTIEGDLVVSGGCTILGTPTIENWTVVELADNIIFVNSGPSGSKNAGYAVERYQVANDAGTGDVVGDSAARVELISDIGDQSGQDSTHIYLGARASGTNDYYAGLWVRTADDNVRKITSSNGTTKIAVVASAFTNQPASNSAVSIYSPFSAVMFDESNNVWKTALLNAADAIVAVMPFAAGAIDGTTLTASTGFVGPYIKSLGGDFTVAGGNGAGGLLFKTNGTTGSTKLDIDHTGGLTVYDDVQPDTDSAYNFGDSTHAWATGYFDTLTSLNANDRLKLGTDAQVGLAYPVFTDAERDANLTPVEGDVIYNSDAGSLEVYDGAAWVALGAGSDTSGLTGTTNASYTINSDGAPSDTNASLILISDNDSDNDTGTLTYVAAVGGGTNAGVWSFAADVRIADGKHLYIGTDNDIAASWDGDDLVLNVAGGLNADFTAAVAIDSAAGISIDAGGASNFSVTSANFTLSTLTAGDIAVTSAGLVDIDAVDALSLNSSGGAINIGNDAVTQAINIGTGAAARTVTLGNVSGATALELKTGTGGFSWVEGGLSNSATDAPGAANDIVFLRSDGLSKADAAARSTSHVKGAYTGTSGQVKKGKVVFTKMFTNAGGTTYDNIAKGDEIWLAAAIANEYDAGVTPAKGRVTNRTSVAQTAGTVNVLVGIADAASNGSTATVTVDFNPQYVSTN